MKKPANEKISSAPNGYATARISGKEMQRYAALEELDDKLAVLRKHKVALFTDPESGMTVQFDRSAFVEPAPPRKERKPEEVDPLFDPEEDES
jgi:hypothetical protein